MKNQVTQKDTKSSSGYCKTWIGWKSTLLAKYSSTPMKFRIILFLEFIKLMAFSPRKLKCLKFSFNLAKWLWSYYIFQALRSNDVSKA